MTAPAPEVVSHSPAVASVKVEMVDVVSAAPVGPPLAKDGKNFDITTDLSKILAQLNTLEQIPAPATVPAEIQTERRRPSWLQIVLLMSGAAILGGFVGREFPRHPPLTAAIPAVQPVSAPPEKAAVEPPSLGVSGKVTYSDKNDVSRPDSQARILLLPLKRQGAVKLSGNGFRVGADKVDWEVLGGEVTALGGDCGVADEFGEFHLKAPGPDRYGLLIASHFQARDPNEPITPACQSFLESYFTRPDQILGNVQVDFREIPIDDATTIERVIHFARK